MSGEPKPEPDGGFQTDSAKARFSYTNDILAGALVAFAIAATMYYVLEGQDVPMWLATADVIGYHEDRNLYLGEGDSPTFSTQIGVWNPTGDVVGTLRGMGSVVWPDNEPPATTLTDFGDRGDR